MAPINTAIIGYGSSAKTFHIPFILSLPSQYKLHSILQRHPTSNNDAKADHPEISKVYSNLPDLLADAEIDLVVITSIPDTHYEFTKAALQAGKHVLCEKPFVATSKEAEELDEIAKTCGRMLCVYQNRRWDADYLRARQLVQSGVLGTVAEFESHFDRYRPNPPPQTWKTAPSSTSGAIYDLGTHLLDQIISLFGMPTSVTGFITNQRGPGHASPGGDSFSVYLQYDEYHLEGRHPKEVKRDGPLLVTAKASIISPETDQLRFWVRGTKGSFKSFGMDVQEDQLKKGMKPEGFSKGKTPSDDKDDGFGVDMQPGTLTLFQDEGKEGTGQLVKKDLEVDHQPLTYLQIYKELGDAIMSVTGKGQGSGSVDGPVPIKEVINTLKVLEAVKESSEQARSVKM